MARGSLFIQRPEDALRHVTLLAKGLKKIALAGWVGGSSCAVLALLVGHYLGVRQTESNAIPGFREMSGITLVISFMASALLVFSSLYYVSGWGLDHQKNWARYFATGTLLAKVLLCVWLGRSSLAAMILFLLIASWDFYGLWVLLSKETAQLLSPQQTSLPQSQQAPVKPANLVT
ncbi:MAG: hypothetical protein ACLPWF_25200 [Bryobacteraceae bacterium]